MVLVNQKIEKETVNQAVNRSAKSALLVDDEEVIGTIVSKKLKELNIQTTYSPSFTEAKEIIYEKMFDYYIFDIDLPDGSGLDLLQLLDEKKAGGIKIVISAYCHGEIKKKAINRGADFILHKPFRLNDLLKYILESS